MVGLTLSRDSAAGPAGANRADAPRGRQHPFARGARWCCADRYPVMTCPRPCANVGLPVSAQRSCDQRKVARLLGLRARASAQGVRGPRRTPDQRSARSVSVKSNRVRLMPAARSARRRASPGGGRFSMGCRGGGTTRRGRGGSGAVTWVLLQLAVTGAPEVWGSQQGLPGDLTPADDGGWAAGRSSGVVRFGGRAGLALSGIAPEPEQSQ